MVAIPHDPRRRHERHTSDVVTCELGDLLDISASGMRIGCKGKPPVNPGKAGNVKLKYPGGALSITVLCRWRKRAGFRRYELGLEFVNIAPAVTEAIDSLARFGFIRTDSTTSKSNGPKSRKRVRASVELPDYYKILGIEPDATAEDIKKAYRRLARETHPDVSHDKAAQEKFIQIREAYDILQDAEQRGTYDLRQAG
ncbi:MAG: DnaJ domain-containing protein [Phycisphaeraceae bacterium]